MNISTFSPLVGLGLLAAVPRILADTSGDVGFLILCFVWSCFMVIFVAVPIIGLMRIFKKAGQPEWHALIPILSGAVLAHIVGREWWWGVIPYLNLVPFYELAKAFGKDSAYGIGLVLLSPIFIPMLGFGKAQYQLERKPPLF